MILSNRGSFSIVGTMVALTISVGVMLATTTVIFKVSQDKAKVNLQAQIDFLHLEGLHILSNQKSLKKLFLDQVPQVYACFQSKGVGCKSLDGRILHAQDPEKKVFLTSYFGANGPCQSVEKGVCPYQRVAQVKIECALDTKCQRIEIDLQTSHVGSQTVRPQQTTRFLSARALDQRRNLDFRCVAGERFISGIDYENLAVKCDGLPDIKLNCSSGFPLQGLGELAPVACHPSPVHGNCGVRGLSATSLNGGSSDCTL